MQCIIHIVVNHPRIKWLLIIGITASIIAGFYLYSQKYEIANLNSPSSAIVAFGDSLVQGVGATPETNFVALLSNAINKPIINLGVSGDTTEKALQRINEIYTYNPRLVIVLLGGNDFLRKIPADEMFRNLGIIVDDIQSHGAAVLLLGVRGGLLYDSYDSRFRKFARIHKTGFVPNVLDGLIGEPKLMYDAIHPNATGYSLIAKKVLPVLTEMLK